MSFWNFTVFNVVSVHYSAHILQINDLKSIIWLVFVVLCVLDVLGVLNVLAVLPGDRFGKRAGGGLWDGGDLMNWLGRGGVLARLVEQLMAFGATKDWLPQGVVSCAAPPCSGGRRSRQIPSSAAAARPHFVASLV